MAVINFASSLKQSRSQAINAALGQSALIRLYTGAIPPNPETPATGTLLSTLTGNAAAWGTVVASGVNAVNVGNGGAGYASVPGVTFTGGGGTGAAATAIVSGGVVTQVTMTSPGSGYTSAPVVGLSGGGASTVASGLTATLGVALQSGAITQDSAAGNSGNPGWARLLTSAGATVADIDVSGVGGGGALQIIPLALTAGAPVTCSSFLVEEL